MICAEIDSNGALVNAPCTSSNYRLYTEAEIVQLHQSPWALTVPQGAAIGMAIISVWAIAFGWRAIASALKHGNSPD